MRYEIEPGGEIYKSLALKYHARLAELRKDLRLPIMRKSYPLGNGRIDLVSGESVDSIRITGGVVYYGMYIDPISDVVRLYDLDARGKSAGLSYGSKFAIMAQHHMTPITGFNKFSSKERYWLTDIDSGGTGIFGYNYFSNLPVSELPPLYLTRGRNILYTFDPTLIPATHRLARVFIDDYGGVLVFSPEDNNFNELENPGSGVLYVCVREVEGVITVVVRTLVDFISPHIQNTGLTPVYGLRNGQLTLAAQNLFSPNSAACMGFVSGFGYYGDFSLSGVAANAIYLTVPYIVSTSVATHIYGYYDPTNDNVDGPYIPVYMETHTASVRRREVMLSVSSTGVATEIYTKTRSTVVEAYINANNNEGFLFASDIALKSGDIGSRPTWSTYHDGNTWPASSGGGGQDFPFPPGGHYVFEMFTAIYEHGSRSFPGGVEYYTDRTREYVGASETTYYPVFAGPGGGVVTLATTLRKKILGGGTSTVYNLPTDVVNVPPGISVAGAYVYSYDYDDYFTYNTRRVITSDGVPCFLFTHATNIEYNSFDNVVLTVYLVKGETVTAGPITSDISSIYFTLFNFLPMTDGVHILEFFNIPGRDDGDPPIPSMRILRGSEVLTTMPEDWYFSGYGAGEIYAFADDPFRFFTTAGPKDPENPNTASLFPRNIYIKQNEETGEWEWSGPKLVEAQYTISDYYPKDPADPSRSKRDFTNAANWNFPFRMVPYGSVALHSYIPT